MKQSKLLKELNRLNLKSLTKEVLVKSTELLTKYPKLNIFDSIHLAHAILEGERVLSTDHLFDEVEEVVRLDPLRD